MARLSKFLESPIVVGPRCDETGEEHDGQHPPGQHRTTSQHEVDNVHCRLHCEHGDEGHTDGHSKRC